MARACGMAARVGLAQGASRTFWVRRRYQHTNQPLPWRHGWQWLPRVDRDRQLLVAQRARRGPWNDSAPLPALVEAAHQVLPMGVVLAAAEFDRERHPT